jgi:hypothetical protein
VIGNVINQFRQHYGFPLAELVAKEEHEHCRFHCIYMTKGPGLVHTPDYLLAGKAEVVAMCSFRNNIEETENFLIWQIIQSSPEHKEIILNSKYLAHYLFLHHYQAYLTIRGWN